MASKVVLFASVALAIFDASNSQCIKNLLPNCGCGGIDVFQNQLLLNQPGFVAPGVLAQPGLVQSGVYPGMVAGNVIPGLASNVVSPVINGQYALPGTNIIQASNSKCIKNLLPNCGCGGIDVFQNQLLLNQPGFVAPGVLAQPGLVQSGVYTGMVAGNVIPGLASNVVSPVINGQYALPGTNIIQDNTVATNLANTLQLLLVSNLLSNTLPNSPDVLTMPAVSPYGAGLSYIC